MMCLKLQNLQILFFHIIKHIKPCLSLVISLKTRVTDFFQHIILIFYNSKKLLRHEAKYSSQTIIVDFRHRFTVINMNDTPVPIGQINLFHSYV